MVLTRRNLDWWCERGILTLVLALLAFAPVAFGAVYAWTFLVVQMLAVGLAGLWIIRLWFGYKPKLLWPPLVWGVVAFVLYAVARYFTADIEYEARQELIRVLLYAFVFLAVLSNLYNQESASTITYTLTAVAAVTALYAVGQFFHHSNRIWDITSPYSGRASGTYVNPDHFAGFLELVLPLPLAYLLAARIGIISRVLLGYAALAIVAGLAVTFSRGGWVAAGAGVLMLMVFLLGHRNHRLHALLVLAVLLLGAGLFTAHFLAHSVTYMRRVARPDNVGANPLNMNSRLDMWTSAIGMWEDHPVWGVGPGHFDYRFREYRPERFQLRPQHAHNDYLELLADWGLAGTAIVAGGIGLFVLGLRRSWPHVRRAENDFGSGMSTRYAFFLGSVSGLFALAVHSAMDFNLHIPGNALVGVTLLALVTASLRFASNRYWVRVRLPGQVALTAVIGLLVFYIGTQMWRRAGEAYWTTRAENLQIYSTEQAEALQKALACEPKNYLTAYNIGECYRVQSFDGDDNYAEQAQKALKFYHRGAELDPYDAYCLLRTGMCLDWLGRHEEAEAYYSAAERLDPNGNFVLANIGWHYIQVADYAAARQWFLRANRLDGGNQIARSYLFDILEPKLADRASGRIPLSLFENGKGH